MTGEMRDRIAQAIATAVGEKNPLEPTLLRESFYSDAAVEVLKAMRHPTEGMKGYAKHRLPGIERGTAHDVWMLMIDEALAK